MITRNVERGVKIFFSDNKIQFFFFNYNLPYSLPRIVSDMSGSFWSGQQVAYDRILHLALSVPAPIIATGTGPAPSSVKAAVAAPIFFCPQAIRKAILFVRVLVGKRETCC